MPRRVPARKTIRMVAATAIARIALSYYNKYTYNIRFSAPTWVQRVRWYAAAAQELPQIGKTGLPCLRAMPFASTR